MPATDAIEDHQETATEQKVGPVHTTKGLVDRELLTVKDIISEEPNARVIATEWFLGDELVRRDVAVSILRGQALAGEQADI